MRQAYEVRQQFLAFFEARAHKIVDSAPIVVKNDPSLMFTNAGMNQFKDFFLGNKKAVDKRVANTQKCLRVSGKHNDLEEVGVDTYHHTMFEMLGNWSFGDFFKTESIEWAWMLLTDVYGLDQDRLYVTVFGGDDEDGLAEDAEAAAIWSKFVSEDKILRYGKKDNFWEMGETGPCGPCSEIHIDLRPDAERNKVDAKTLVNNDHDQVIELWNLVFIQFNRKADGRLENLPEKHVDTGMGLERVVRAINSMNSNYDTDLFMDTIGELENISGKKYGKDKQTDIAFRVISDHLRAVAFTIADGQLPSNDKAGYVVRRILRRAIRYGYSYLGLEKPFMAKLVNKLAAKFENVFPELAKQNEFVQNVITQEEKSFLNTLNKGLKLFDQFLDHGEKKLSGSSAFELYDTFGFPIDLTQLLAREKGIEVDITGFEKELAEQKNRSRADAKKEAGDWIVLVEDEHEEFVGYDYLESQVKITRYREVKVKGKIKYHLVFNLTPFYAESGGQVGDKGIIVGKNNEEVVPILDTFKENDLSIQISEKLPENLTQAFQAKVNVDLRTKTTSNHTATHLLHAALKKVLGEHVNQKGSLVNPEHLRFDFSHFQKVEKEDLEQIEALVNAKIRSAIPLEEARNVPYPEAINKGAMALFGEKYGDVVRVITFDKDYSVELCGGTHVANTSEIGSFKILHETSVAAGVRRIEAISSDKANEFITNRLHDYDRLNVLLGNQKDPVEALNKLLEKNKMLEDKIDELESAAVMQIKSELKSKIVTGEKVNTLVEIVDVNTAAQVKDLAYQLDNEIENLVCILLANLQGKPSLTILINDSLTKSMELNAGQLVRTWAKEIKGGGGGQPFFAQAGGSDLSGLSKIKEIAQEFASKL